ncbi:Macoilin [Taenia crassiceps]|uniref:Macoilin n=1 Tax=Taenia crassiceps TaxID=6207 RepID=A0ABR4Q9Q9_9CEST
MYVRRKNCEYGRIKRSNRKPKPCDTFSNTFGSYLKLFLIWSTIVVLDFLMEFRFEYMWPCWLLIRTINDSFKYQGVTFAIFFTMIALTSDFICYLIVPSSWLFLFGSTCVWMELVWHAERGVCAPTVAMCFLFLYVEVAVRLRDPKSIPLSIDLCRPFAAHCIGYPVVTLGFGLKSLLTHQLRLRRQHQVEAHNSKYFCLLELALPEEARTLHRRGELGNGQLAVMGSPNANSGNLAINAAPSTSTANWLPTTSASISAAPAPAATANATSTPSAPTTTKNSRKQQQQQQNQTNGKSAPVANNCDHSQTSNHVAVDRKFFGFDGGDQNQQHQNQHHHHHHNQHQHNHLGEEAGGCCEATAVSSSCSSLSGQEVVEVRAPKKSPTTTIANSSGGLSQGHSGSSSAPNNRSKASEKSFRSGKDASVYRLEDELRRLRHERQTMLVTESELRAQLAQLTTLERTSRTETNQARQEVEYLQSKLTTLTQRLETERENLQLAEKKAAEEKRQRNALETSLATEKRARREAENALKAATPFGSVTNSIVTTSAPPATTSKGVAKLGVGSVGNNRPVGSSGGSGTGGMNLNRCTSESCNHRIHELETRLKSLTRELSMKEAQLIAASQSNLLKQSQQQQQQQHQSCEQSHRIADLMIHLGDLEAENARLKAAIKSEEKMKQELLAGYHNSLKEITELNSTLTRKEYQIVDLHMRLDMMNPNSPFNIILASDASSGPDGRGGGHPRTSTSFLNTTSAGGGSGSSLFPPRSTDNDFDFGGGSGWPPFPTSSAATSVAFSEHHQHQQQQQQHRLRSESTSAVLNVLMSAREDKSTIQPPLPPPPRFDTNAEVDLEVASSSLSPPEFLSKLRTQLAMAGAANGPPPQPQPPPQPPQRAPQQQPAPISPPSRDIVSAISVEPESLPQISPGAVAEIEGDTAGGGSGVMGEEVGAGKAGG